MDSCATAVELADARIALKATIEENEAATTKRHYEAEDRLGAHDKILATHQDSNKHFASKKDVEDLQERCAKADVEQIEETARVEQRAATNLAEVNTTLEARHARSEEKLEMHAFKIKNAEESVRTKADREMVQVC